MVGGGQGGLGWRRVKISEKPTESLSSRIRKAAWVFRQIPGTVSLVWRADRRNTLAVGALTLISALLPAAIAYVGKLIVDTVLAAARSGSAAGRSRALVFLLGELLLIVLSPTAARSL